MFDLVTELDPAKGVRQWPEPPLMVWSDESRASSGELLSSSSASASGVGGGLESVLRRVRRSSAAVATRGRPRLRWWGPITAAATVVVAGVVYGGVSGEPAVAATPAPLALQYESGADSASGALRDLADRLAIEARRDPTEDRSGRFEYVDVKLWALDLAAGGGRTAVQIVPQREQKWRSADGTGRLSVATLPAEPPGTRSSGFPAGPPLATQVTEFSAGQFLPVVAEPVPTSVPALRAALYARQPQINGPQSALRAVADLYRSQVVSMSARIAVLRVLADVNGVLYRGHVTDRLGRAGTAISVDSTNGTTGKNRDLLIFDDTTGQLLAHESLILIAPHQVHVKAPAVFSYILYLDQGYADAMK
ncbi:CU044_5270 family protein [Micromonospora sp. CPCC 206061]|uniref:CU044_5270 family protein n=1 Tax=Micromonospora sp. CPCC 206061 TaxID=3122410 RepID=UPI002FF0B9DA